MAAAAPKPGATVLLVEDDDALRDVLGRALADAGYKVLTAADGEEALALAGTLIGRLALVITDIRMPVMDGLTLAGHLAHLPSPPPVLFITGYAEVNEVPGPCLNKPFRPAVLVEAVGQIVSTPVH